jgi:L-cysteine desulfidase
MKKCHIKNSNEPSKIYKEILIKLKENISDSTNDLLTEDIEKSVHNEILLTMFEMYRESNERIIEELIAENNVKNF